MKESRLSTSMFFDALRMILHVLSIEIQPGCQDALIKLVIPFLTGGVFDRSISNLTACWFARERRINEWHVVCCCMYDDSDNLFNSTKSMSTASLFEESRLSILISFRRPPPLITKVVLMTSMWSMNPCKFVFFVCFQCRWWCNFSVACYHYFIICN